MGNQQHNDGYTDLIYSAVRLVPSNGIPTNQDVALINDRFAKDALSADDVFVFSGVASTDAVDAYYTHMDPDTSLRNFVEDFSAGQALLDSHNILRLPIGNSFRAELRAIRSAEGTAATAQVIADWYMLRHQTVAGTSTEDYRRGILGGTYRRMSVGFGGPDMRWVCDVDGRDLWESDYWPGQRLKDGKRVTFTVVNARAMECSLVYRNATPGALVQRVQQLITERQIPPQDVAGLEQAWHVRFVGTPRLTQGARIVANELTARGLLEGVQQRVGKTISKATRAKLDAAVTRLGEAQGGIDDAAAAIATLLEEVDAEAEGSRALLAELGDQASADGIRALKAQADAGHAYTNRLIDDAVKHRRAVEGDRYTADREQKHRARLARLDTDELEDERDDWAQRRGETFQSGRRVPLHDPNASDEQPGVHGRFKVVQGPAETGKEAQ